MLPSSRARILCVDDEPHVLEGLALHLRRRYDVDLASGGVPGLAALERHPDTAVVVSDMRMPGMDGVAFLRTVRRVAPDVVRVLLTGQADLESAIAVVNEGQIFRFLTKPCPPPALLAALEAAAEQHRLLTAERVLLEQTLHGSIKALTDVLALTNPVAFGRASRIRQRVTDLAAKLQLRDRWQVEVAAMLSQMAFITLPADTAERVACGRSLSEEEQAMVDRLPALTEQLLGHIPRLEVVRAILAAWAALPGRGAAGQDPVVQQGAALLRVAFDYDVLEAQGKQPALAIDVLRGRADRYDPRILEALDDLCGGGGPSVEIREVPLAGLRVGMVLADDVRMTGGVLLVARGHEVTPGLVERLNNLRRQVKEPIQVVVR